MPLLRVWCRTLVCRRSSRASLQSQLGLQCIWTVCHSTDRFKSLLPTLWTREGLGSQSSPVLCQIPLSSRSPQTPARCFFVHGILKNTNTINEFKDCDKKALLQEQGQQVLLQRMQHFILNSAKRMGLALVELHFLAPVWALCEVSTAWMWHIACRWSLWYVCWFVCCFQLWQAIISGEAIRNPSLLARFLLLTFAVSTHSVVTQ